MIHRSIRPLAAAAVLLAAALPCAARQAVPDTVHAFPGVTVTAPRGAAAAARASVRVTQLDGEDFAESGARNLAELLSARAPVFVRRYGEGGLATLSLRGTTASQTLLLLDGQRLTDPQLGQVDLSLLPALLLESVEIAHGAGSSLYGSEGMGGVINLRTRGRGEPGVDASLGYGAFGARTGGVLASARRGRFSGAALVEGERSEGDFPFVNRTLFPARTVRRTGADRARRSMYGTLGYEAGAGQVSVSAWYGAAERGLPGPSVAPPKGERQWDEQLRLWAGGSRRLPGGTFRAGGFLNEGTLRYHNPERGVDETGRTRTASFEAEATRAVGSRALLGGGVSAGYSRARHPSLPADPSELHGGAFTYGTVELPRLLVYPALRLDAHRPHGRGAPHAVLSPRLGVNVQPLRTAALHLKLNAARGFRTPTFNERFWQPGGRPDLRPEDGWTLDAGLFLRRGGARAELTLFALRVRDQILWEPGAHGVWTPGNVSRTRTRGWELSLGWERADARGRVLHAGFLHTLTDARDRSDPASPAFGRPLRYVPRHQAKLDAGLRAGPLALDLAGQFTGSRPVTTDGTQALDPFVELSAGARLARAFGFGRATLELRVENLLDAEYAVIQHHPMPPRHARLRLVVHTR